MLTRARVTLTLLVIICCAMLTFIVWVAWTQDDTPLIYLLLPSVLLGGQLVLHLRGWRHSSNALIISIMLIVIAGTPSSYMREHLTITALVPTVLAAVLLSPRWTIAIFVGTMLGLAVHISLISAGPAGIVLGPTFDIVNLLILSIVTAGIATASAVARSAQHAAEAQAQQAHEAARRADETLALLDTVMQSAPIGFAFVDRDLRYQLINSRLAALNGLPPAAHLGHTISTLLPKRAATVTPILQQVLAQGDAVLDVELVVSTAASQDQHWLCNYYPVRTRDGELLGVGTVTFDISERKQAEQATRESEERFRATFEQAPVGIAHIIPGGRLLRVNQQLCEILGYTRAELLTLTIYDIGSPRLGAIARAGAPQLLKHEVASVTLEDHFARKDGTARWIDVTVSLMSDDRGAPLYFIAVVEDITEHKRAEAALRASEERFRMLAEHAQDVIIRYRFAPSRGFEYVSPSVVALSGYTPEEHYADPDLFKKLMPLDDQHLVLNLEQHLDGRLPVVMQIITKAGAPLWVEQRSVSIHDAEGCLVAGQMIIRDITARRQAELALIAERALLAQRVEERTADLSAANAELARTARLKDEFLASMSHELRTPLNAVLGLTEALREQIYGPLTDRQEHTLQTIEESGRHLLDLINDILDLAKIGAGKLDLSVVSTPIAPICQTSLRMIQQAAQKKSVEVQFDLNPSAEQVRADARRLKQILMNLLSNAVKFTPSGGKVGLEVTISADQSAVIFTVWDTGIGIAPDQLAHLFQPFVQLDGRLARQYGGTGLGLALVARMTELHGGSVTVTSTLGVGSRFSVALPVGERAASQHSPMSAASLPATGAHGQSSSGAGEISGPPIVLAEDNETNITTVIDYLTTIGYRVVVARNGEEAIARTYEVRPALILMDVQMPGVDGLEATRRIRADAQLADIPIVTLTALAMPGDRERCLAAGANEYLSKPVSLKLLATTIAHYLQPMANH